MLCGQHQVTQVELRLRRAEIMMMLGHLREACQELLEVGSDSAAALERPAVECEARVLLGDIDQRQGRAMQAGRRLADAEELTRAVGDPNLTIKVAFCVVSTPCRLLCRARQGDRGSAQRRRDSRGDRGPGSCCRRPFAFGGDPDQPRRPGVGGGRPRELPRARR